MRSGISIRVIDMYSEHPPQNTCYTDCALKMLFYNFPFGLRAGA